MKANSTSEDEFLHLLYEIQKGEKPIDSLLIHPEFERRGRQFCYMYQTHYVSAEYGPEDLYHDACLKVLNHPDALSNVDNIPNKQAFFSWFRAVVFNVFIDEIRKQKRKRIPKDTLPIEGIDIADSDDPDARLLLREFIEFIKPLPESHQRAITLWLEGYSLREISKILNDEKINNSHVTVRSWISNALSDFKILLKK